MYFDIHRQIIRRTSLRKKLKVPFKLALNHQAIKVHSLITLTLDTFLGLALCGGKWCVSPHGSLTLEHKVIATYSIGGDMDSKYACETLKIKSNVLCLEWLVTTAGKLLHALAMLIRSLFFCRLIFVKIKKF
jgi:hypothetical protein